MEISGLATSIVGLKKEISELQSQLKGLTQGTKEYTDATNQLAQKEKDLASAQADMKQQLNENFGWTQKNAEANKEQAKTVNENINVLSQMRAEQKEIIGQMAQLNLANKQGSEEYLKLAARAGELRDAIDDASRDVRDFADDTKMMTDVLEGVKFGAAAFGVVSASMEMLGIQSEKTEAVLRKFAMTQQLLSSVQALQNTLMDKSSVVTRALSGAYNLCTKAVVAFNGATKATKVAIASTGIGLLVVALGELVAHWDDVTGAIKRFIGAAPEVSEAAKAQAQYIKEVTQKTSDHVAETGIAIKRLFELKNAYEQTNSALEKKKIIEDAKKIMNEYGIVLKNDAAYADALTRSTTQLTEAIRIQGEIAALQSTRTEMFKESFKNLYESYAGQDPSYQFEAAFSLASASVANLDKEIEKLKKDSSGVLDSLGAIRIPDPGTSGTKNTVKSTKATIDHTKATKEAIEAIKRQYEQEKKLIDLQKEHDDIYTKVNDDIINLAKLDIDVTGLEKIIVEYDKILKSGKLTADELKSVQKDYLITVVELSNKRREREIQNEKIQTSDFREEVDKRIEEIKRLAEEAQQSKDIELEIRVSRKELSETKNADAAKDTDEYKIEEEKWNTKIDIAKQKQLEYQNVLDEMAKQGISEEDEQFQSIKELFQSQTDILTLLMKMRMAGLLAIQAKAAKELDDKKKEEVENEKEEKEQIIQAYASMASAIGAIMGAVNDIMEENLKKEIANGKISEEEAKRKFERQKKLQIGETIISTLAGAIGAFMQDKKSYPAPYNYIVAGIDMATTLAAGFAQVQQIRNQEMDSNSGGSSGSSTVTVVPQAVPILDENRDLMDMSTISTAVGVNSQPTTDTRVYVTEKDITDTQNKVKVAEQNSKF